MWLENMTRPMIEASATQEALWLDGPGRQDCASRRSFARITLRLANCFTPSGILDSLIHDDRRHTPLPSNADASIGKEDSSDASAKPSHRRSLGLA